MKEEEYTKDGEVYKEVFDKKESNSRNVVTIAARRPEIYIETMLKKMEQHDQIELCCLDRYLDKTIEIIHLWAAAGIVPINGKIVFEKREEDLIERDEKGRATGGRYKRAVNRITLTKIPELFRFTEP